MAQRLYWTVLCWISAWAAKHISVKPQWKYIATLLCSIYGKFEQDSQCISKSALTSLCLTKPFNPTHFNKIVYKCICASADRRPLENKIAFIVFFFLSRIWTFVNCLVMVREHFLIINLLQHSLFLPLACKKKLLVPTLVHNKITIKCMVMKEVA